MGIRRNILANATDQANFIEGCRRLKRTDAGLSTSDLGIDGGPRASSRPLSVWDLFVIWHVWAMQEMSPDGRRNAAHMGPVFLPWHRWYLLLLEFQIQNALEVSQDEFGPPYWDWAEWQQQHPTSSYLPGGQSALGDPLFRHREFDLLHSVLTQDAPRVQDMLDVSNFYTYG